MELGTDQKEGVPPHGQPGPVQSNSASRRATAAAALQPVLGRSQHTKVRLGAMHGTTQWARTTTARKLDFSRRLPNSIRPSARPIHLLRTQRPSTHTHTHKYSFLLLPLPTPTLAPQNPPLSHFDCPRFANMLKKSVLANTGKGRSEEHISTSKFPAELVKRALKEKSQSSNALKVGPFAAIKESEKRKKMSGSLDTEEEEAKMDETEQEPQNGK